MPHAFRAPAGLAATGAALAIAVAPGSAVAADPYIDVARNIVPSGQYGQAAPRPDADEQARMYDALTPKLDRVTDRDLRTDFKSERLGTQDDGPYTDVPVEREGVSIRLDRFGVPHIKATDRDGLTWATGYMIVRERNLLFEQARGAARVAALSAPNVDAFSLVRNLRTFTPSAETERFVARQTDVLRAAGPKGRALLRDIDVYVEGLNAGRRSINATTKPYTRNDVYAANALLGQIFGEGGGGEAESASFLADLRAKLGARAGMRAFDELTQTRDPAHPATLRERFTYQPRPSTRDGRVPAGSVALDRGSFEPVTPAGASPRREPGEAHASNFLAIGAKASRTGRPLFVAGPQVGYFYPGLTYEVDLEAPGIQARGVTAPGFPGNVLIGRAQDYAWSLTSAGSDLIDTYAETLCGGSRTRYRYKGRCRSMQRVRAGQVSGAGELTFLRTVHGPVSGYARVGGKLVALARKRASEGRDAEFQTVFRDLTLGKARTTSRFNDVVAQSPFTFNVGYVNSRDAAMYSAGRLPLRPKDVDPRLPTKGGGDHEWRGFLADEDHPQGTAPENGWLTNWNNLPARGFPASDRSVSQGGVQRVDLLNGNLRRQRRLGGGRLTLARTTGAMNLAATQDLRTMRLVPVLREVLEKADAPSSRAAEMVALLERWRLRGGSRIDADADGRVDDPGAAVIDASYARMADAAFEARLGRRAGEAFAAVAGRDNRPASGFTGGRLTQLITDLRAVSGEDDVRGGYTTRYCGRGSATACARSLWAVIDEAGAELAARQGADPAAWRADAKAERITFAPGLLRTSIAYTNRPSGIQQVISFRSGRSTR